MNITDRDKKIITMLLPIVLIGAYWHFVLSPKRSEANQVGTELTQVQQKRDTAQSQVNLLNSAKQSFASDYQTVINLGKAIPSTVDMPSLLVQLDTAAAGTGIEFKNVHLGDRQNSPAPAAASTPPGGGSNPASSGAPASSGTGGVATNPGKAASTTGAAVTSANNQNQAGANAANGTAGSASAGGASSPGVQGLDSIPLDFTFKGQFDNLADFFHQMKRFVQVVNGSIQVHGRLMTIDSFTFASGDTFPSLTADVKATVYLAPKAEGIAAGATPQGPAGAAGSPTTTPASSTSPSTSSPSAPTAAVTR